VSKTRITAALAVAAAAAGVLLAGCGGTSAAQVQASHATQACQALASATGVFNELGGVNGLSGNTAQFAATQVALQDPPSGYYSSQFAADLAGVVSAPVPTTGDTPTGTPASAVHQLSADSTTAGVTGPSGPLS
jgi:hypothetical protein